jgi:hypothetical protein
MLYGEPGIGKSTLAGTSPRALILANNADEVVSMKRSPAKPTIKVVANINDLTEAYEHLRHGGYKEFDWVWLDNGSLWQDQNMDFIMENLVAAKPHRSRYTPDKAEYGQNQQMFGVWVRNMVTLPINFGMTAHVMRKVDKVTEDEKLMPLFQGGQGEFSQKLCGWMNVVGYMHASRKSKGNRLLRTAADAEVMAKDRFGALKAIEVNPTIPKLVTAIKKG